jgi:hypothetical protein
MFGFRGGVFSQATATFCKKLIIALAFEKSANFFAKNWKKIVTISSTPGISGRTETYSAVSNDRFPNAGRPLLKN